MACDSSSDSQDNIELKNNVFGNQFLNNWAFWLEFVFYFDLELHLEVCQNQSKKIDEASTSSRSLSGEGMSEGGNVEGTGAAESVLSFKEEISEEPSGPNSA